jgi:N6-adenosine-specific RNA methylase IME4
VKRWLYRATGEEISSLGGFSVIYGDPCWKYRVQGGRGAADKQYQTMSLAELCLLPVEKLAAPDSVMFLWGVFPMLLEAGALMKAWGFEYKNCGFIWVKTNPISPTPFFGMGHWTRGNAEFCLLGVRGKPKRVDATVRQIVEDNLIVAPIGEHSAKPDEVRQRITRLMGEDQPAIELFARRPAPGWECWGNEVESTVVLEYGGAHEEGESGSEPQAGERNGADVGREHGGSDGEAAA